MSSAPTTLGGRISLRLDYERTGEMRLKLDPTVNVPDAVVRFPLTAGASLKSVRVNGNPVSDFNGNTVTLKNLSGETEVDAAF
jgi:hypothetical protein